MPDDLERVVEVTYQVPKPVEKFQKKFSKNGYLYREWEYNYKVVVSGASFDLIVVSDGEEISTEKILVDMA